EASVKGLADARTRVVDLRGRLALPGFHDAHTHLLSAGLVREELDLTAARTDADVLDGVSARARERGDGAWVLGRGFDPDKLGAWPSRAALDRAAPRSPVLLVRRDGHAAVASTLALERAGVSKTTADPTGGKIARG